MSKPLIAVDVSQFFNQPTASGIQRVLAELAANWPDELAEGRFVYSDGKGFRIISGSDLSEIINSLFTEHAPPARWRKLVAKAGIQATKSKVSKSDLLDQVDAWLLPELTTNLAVLHSFDEAAARVPAALIFYDAIPEISPGSFSNSVGFSQISRYFRRAAIAPIVISISEESDRCLTERLRRPAGLPSYVAHPGGDHVPASTSDAPEFPTFSIIGTLEPRKRHDLIIDAFIRVAPTLPDAKLVLAGRKHAAAHQLGGIVSAAQAEGVAIEWIDSPSDADVRSVYESSTVVFSIGEEGYGLPVLEALRQGCPVAFGGTQPAAELSEGFGAVRLDEVSVDAVADFMLKMGDRALAQDLRSTVSADHVPQWADFAHDVVAPIAAHVAARPRPGAVRQDRRARAQLSRSSVAK